jgi:membrane-associated protein
MSDIISLDIYYLLYYFIAIFAASFALPTGAMILIVSFASIAVGFTDLAILGSLALAATVLGDFSAYSVAKYFKKRLDGYIDRFVWLGNKIDKIGVIFQKYGRYTVFLSRFAFSGLGPYVNLFSGLRALPKRLFLQAMIAGEIIYVALFMSVGYFFRETWQMVVLIVKDYTVSMVLVVLGIFIALRLVKLLLKEKILQ